MAIRGDGVYSELYVTPHWYLLSFDNINYKEPVPYHRILYILVGQIVFFYRNCIPARQYFYR